MYFFIEPVKLFRHYFSQKYESSESLVNLLFGKVENVIKEVRNFKTTEQLLLSWDIEIIIMPDLFYCFVNKYEFKHNKVELYSPKMLYEDLIPNEIDFLLNKKVNRNPIAAKVLFDEEASLVIYPNCLVLDNQKK